MPPLVSGRGNAVTRRRCDEEDALVRAKLRVRCAECGGGAILLGQDPGSWDDVLRPRRIQVRNYVRSGTLKM